MTEAQLKKWIADLRSGKFKQCFGALHDGSGHCCLGVLAEQTGRKIRGDVYGKIGFEFDGEADPGRKVKTFFAVLPTSMIASDVILRLTNMNDAGETFDKIADFIESRCVLDGDGRLVHDGR